MAFGLLSGIGSVLGGLGGLFGKKKSATPALNMLSQAKGAREAAAQYGFNPLTMLQYGQPGGAMGGGGGASPLASIQMITDGLKDIDDITSGDAARRRAADQLNLDLAQLKLDQARSGVVATVPHYAVDGVGPGPSPLGVRPVTVAQTHGGSLGGSYARSGQTGSDGSTDGGLALLGQSRGLSGKRSVAPNLLGDNLHEETGDAGNPAKVPEVPDPQVRGGHDYYLWGMRLESPPNTTSPAVMEELGGEPVGWLWSVPWGMDAVQHNLHRGIDAVGDWWAGDSKYDRKPPRRDEEYPPSYWPRIRYTSPAFRP